MLDLIPKNFPKYFVFGVISVVIDVYVFYLLHDIAGFDKFVATAISLSIGMLNSFTLNAFFNFKTTDKILKRFITFYAVGLLGITLSSVIIYICSDLGGLTPLISKFISIPPVVAVQFILNSQFSFADEKKIINDLESK